MITDTNEDIFTDIQLTIPDYIVKEILLMYPNFDTAELVANKAIEWLEQHYERIISSAAPANLSIIKDGFESGTGIMNIELEQKRKEIVASVEDLVEDFDNVISEKIDDDLAPKLDEVLADLNKILQDAGDFNQTGSLASNIKLGVTNDIQSVVQSVDDAMNLADPKSPASLQLKTLKGEIQPIVKMFEDLKHEVTDILGKLSVKEGFSQMKTVDQGENFEDEISDALQKIAEQYGDIFFDIGQESDKGSNSKKGDHLVEVRSGNIVVGNIIFESKSGVDWTINGTTKKGIQKELEESMNVNKASYGIAVVDVSHEKMYKEVKDWLLINPQPTMFIAGVDTEKDGFAILRNAYRWARIQMIADFHKAQSADNIDIVNVLGKIKKMRLQLKTFQKLDTNFGNLLSNTSGMRNELKQLRRHLLKELDNLELLLDGKQ